MQNRVMRRTPEERLKAQQERNRQGKAKEARMKAVMREREEKAATARALVIGRVIGEVMQADAAFAEMVTRLLDQRVQRADQRKLLGLSE